MNGQKKATITTRNLQAPGPTQKSLVVRKNATTATESVTTPETVAQEVAETHDHAPLVVTTGIDLIQGTEDVAMIVVGPRRSDIVGEAQIETIEGEMTLQDVITTVITARQFAEDPQKRTHDVSLL